MIDLKIHPRDAAAIANPSPSLAAAIARTPAGIVARGYVLPSWAAKRRAKILANILAVANLNTPSEQAFAEYLADIGDGEMVEALAERAAR